MQKNIFIFFILLSTSVLAQKMEQAYSYYLKGDYENAIPLYRALHEKNRIQRDYFKKLITCYQQVDAYEEAEKVILDQKRDFPLLTYTDVELGYNEQLQGNQAKAEQFYQMALKSLGESPQNVYNIGYAFKDNHQLDYALEAYAIAKKINPRLITQIQEAQIYGEQGEMEKMFSSYLDLLDFNEEYENTIERYTAQYINDDPLNEYNVMFRKMLLQRAQNNPKKSYNMLLSWIFIQQQQFDKALVQEKSIYKRDQTNLLKIYEIGMISKEKKDYKSAENAFGFVLENNSNEGLLLQIENHLLEMKIAQANENDFQNIEKEFEGIFELHGLQGKTIPIQLTYADFLTFQLDQPENAMDLLKSAEKYALSALQKGTIKMKLADIMVYNSQFNQALIIYSQIQNELKNSTLAQTARFKVAQTSYFKGDFEWANSQLSVLKSSTSQLIANDALGLHLLILNNIDKDSLQEPLELYAKAELLVYQKKNSEAIRLLDEITTQYKGSLIEDDALNFQARLFANSDQFLKAEENYLKVLNLYPDSILIDRVLFDLANLYENQLEDPEKAKTYYEKIIFNYPSSIYLVEARNQYRKLRGDLVN